jgi:shikimate dehydrogenase
MKRCLIIGDPVAHSLSPAIHNAGYKELGIDGEYRFEARPVKPAQLADFMKELRESDIRGVSCTAPHKTAIMGYLDDIDGTAREIGAVNTVVNDGGRLKGYNTDWLGIVRPLEDMTSLKGRNVVLLGAGGAARSIAYGITRSGARLVIYNRTVEKAQEIAEAYGAESASLDDPAVIRQADIIINATSVGMAPNDSETPLPKEYIAPGQIVFDSIYHPFATRLLREAEKQGAHVIHGTEMLLHQAFEQFKLYTGYDAPEAAMRAALEKAL